MVNTENATTVALPTDFYLPDEFPFRPLDADEDGFPGTTPGENTSPETTTGTTINRDIMPRSDTHAYLAAFECSQILNILGKNKALCLRTIPYLTTFPSVASHSSTTSC